MRIVRKFFSDRQARHTVVCFHWVPNAAGFPRGILQRSAVEATVKKSKRRKEKRWKKQKLTTQIKEIRCFHLHSVQIFDLFIKKSTFRNTNYEWKFQPFNLIENVFSFGKWSCSHCSFTSSSTWAEPITSPWRWQTSGFKVWTSAPHHQTVFLILTSCPGMWWTEGCKQKNVYFCHQIVICVCVCVEI